MAHRLREESARHATRRAAVLTLGALALLVLPLYGIPENTLPPATWTTKPEDIAWAQALALGFWAAALALGGGAVAAAVRDRARLVRTLLAAAVVVGAASAASAAYAAVRWLDEVPGAWEAALLAAVATVAALGVAALGLAWARSKRELVPG